MTDTATRWGPEAIGTAEETLITAAGTAILRNIHIANTTATAATIKMSIGADAAGTRLLSDLSVPANGTYDYDGFIVLTNAETLRAQGGTNNALTVTISGVVVT